MSQEVDAPIYRKIALDIAGRICRGDFKEGEKVHGRSTLASEYNVSPETIRRAVILLEDMKVVAASQGSGVYIKSIQDAYAFVKRFQNKETIQTLKADLKKLMLQKKDIENQISNIMDKIIDYSDRLKSYDSMTPLEIAINDNSHLIGQTVTETKFWQNTGATIIGIRRNGTLILSPGPYGGFEKGDAIIVIGEMNVLERVMEFMKAK